jgi:hypothetical protein
MRGPRLHAIRRTLNAIFTFPSPFEIPCSIFDIPLPFGKFYAILFQKTKEKHLRIYMKNAAFDGLICRFALRDSTRSLVEALNKPKPLAQSNYKAESAAE